MGILRNPKHELFAQGIVAGLSRTEAHKQAGYTGQSTTAVKAVADNPLVVDRIKELLAQSARRSELSRKDILDRIFQDWELARKLGQTASALKAGELMGKELHRMFVDRREVGGPGDFDSKTEEELKEIIRKDLDDLGWDTPPTSH